VTIGSQGLIFRRPRSGHSSDRNTRPKLSTSV
jgi:hypothetical protein